MNAETTAVATKNPVAVFRALLEKQKGQIAAALPKHLTPDRMIRLACTEFAKNALLQECTQVSVFGAIVQAAQLGLEIGVLGQAYLVPFKKNRKVNGQWENTFECQLIPGYKGLIALARRSGEVTSIETNIVYAADKFELQLGIESRLVHEPYLDGERGAARLVYGVAKFKDGGHHLEWMTIGDVERIKAGVFERNKMDEKSKSPWNSDYEQMVRKTLIRRMANYLPMSVEMEAALQVDDAAAKGKGVTIDGDFIVTERGDDDGDPPADNGDKKAPPYPQDQFDKNIATWRKLIADGKKTAEQIIATAQSKGQLTEAQIASLRTPVATETADTPAHPETVALSIIEGIRAKAVSAAITDAEVCKHLGIASLDALTVAQAEQAIAFLNNPMGAK